LGRCNSYDLTEKRIPCVSFFFDYLLCLTRKAILQLISVVSNVR
jgi:hypothetical protein